MGGRRHGALLLSLSLIIGIVVLDQGTSSAQGAGSNVAHEITATDPADGGQIRLESVAAFDPSGGEAIFEPNTAAAEAFTYTGLDSDNNFLVGISRTEPVSHPSGSFVEAVAGPEPSPTPSDEPTPVETSSPAPTTEDSQTPETPDPSDEPSQSSTSTAGEQAGPSGAAVAVDTGIVDDLLRELCGVTLQCPDPQELINEVLGILEVECGGRPLAECVDYQTLVRTVILVVDGYRYELCGYDSWETCVSNILFDAVDIAYRVACPYDYSVDGCTSRYTSMVGGLVWTIHDIPCPGQSTSACLNSKVTYVQTTINEAIDRYCNDNQPATYGELECVGMIQDLVFGVVNTIHELVCPGQSTSACLNSKVTYLQTTINETIDRYCNDNQPATYGELECVGMIQDLVFGVVNTIHTLACGTDTTTICANKKVEFVRATLVGAVELAMTTACQSTSTDVCVTNLVSKVDTTAGSACGLVPMTNAGTTTGLPAGVATCVTKLVGTVHTVMLLACQTTNADLCVSNLINKIDSSLGTTCGLVPIAPSTTISLNGVPLGVSKCVLTVLATAETAIRMICQSTNPQTCAANLINKIDSTLMDSCGLIPVTNSTTGTVTGLPPGVTTCVLKVLGTVELIMRTVCQSTNAETCVANTIAAIDTTLGSRCGALPVPVSTTGAVTGLPPGVATCVLKVLGTIELVMRTVCQSTNPQTCVANTIATIDATLGSSCGTVPVPLGTTGAVTGLPPGVATCVLKVLGTVELAMRTVCQSTNAPTCVANTVAAIDSTLGTACGLAPVTDPTTGAVTGLPAGATTCVLKVLGTVDLVMRTACQSTDRDTCLANLIAAIDSALASACGAVPGTPAGTTTGLPAGVSLCVLKIVGTIELAMRTACRSTDAQVCVANVIAGVHEAIDSVCNDSITTTTGPDECANMVIEEVKRRLEACDQRLCEDPVGAVEDLCDPNNTGQTCVEMILRSLPPVDPCYYVAVLCGPLPDPGTIPCDPDPYGTNPCVPPVPPLPGGVPIPEGVPDDCSLPSSPLDEDLSEPIDDPDTIGAELELGNEHRYNMSNDTNPEDGVVDGLIAHGQNDFPNRNHWDHDQYNDLQAMQIFSYAVVDHRCKTRGGDVGIHKTHKASNSDVFLASARVRIMNERDRSLDGEDFFARLTFHPMNTDQKIIPGNECNDKLRHERAGGEWTVMSVACRMPSRNVGHFRINVRAHARPEYGVAGPNADYTVAGYGTVQVDWLTYEKIVECGTGQC